MQYGDEELIYVVNERNKEIYEMKKVALEKDTVHGILMSDEFLLQIRSYCLAEGKIKKKQRKKTRWNLSREWSYHWW